jgi:hypothetical protein
MLLDKQNDREINFIKEKRIEGNQPQKNKIGK